MQLTLLGTGPASPIPRIYCSCKSCTDARTADSRSRRSRSSALLQVGSKRILFDASPDVLVQLERAKTHSVDAVFFTHAHNDAVGGFFDLKDLLYRQKHPATLYVEPDTWKKVSHRVPKKEIWFQVKFLEPGRSVECLGTTITPFRVLHSAQPGFPTLGYRIADQLVYASDVRQVPKESERFIVGAEHAVLDGCFWFNTHFPTHFTVDETIALANRLRVRNLYLTQISHNYPPHAEAQTLITEHIQQQRFTTQVHLAYDGMRIKLSTTKR